MLIIDSSINWMEDWDNHPTIDMEVDKLPNRKDYRYRAYPVAGGTLYVSDNTEIISFFYHDKNDETGYGGSSFTLIMEDGSEVTIKGPWSSNGTAVERVTGVSSVCAHVKERVTGEYAGATSCHIPEKLAREICEREGAFLIDCTTNNGNTFWKNTPSLDPDKLVKWRNKYEYDGSVRTVVDTIKKEYV